MHNSGTLEDASIHLINYESLIRITNAISMVRDPEEIVLILVGGHPCVECEGVHTVLVR